MKTKNGQLKRKTKKETINLDNEIIIGLSTKNTAKIPSNKKKKKTNTIKINKKSKKQKKSHSLRFAKFFILFILLLICAGFILLSDLFNCKEIIVLGNQKVSTEEIINLSNIKTEENIFKINKWKAIENIKSNAYLDIVKIKRKLDGKVEITVQERTPTYMLTSETGCIYINNQGYILEIANEPITAPIIIGLKTDLKTKKEGDRLDEGDLRSLEKIILISNIAETKGLKDIITYINISAPKDIQIYMDSEKKMVHFGDEQEASKKFDRLKVVMEQEKGNEGEVFIKDIENIYFREKV